MEEKPLTPTDIINFKYDLANIVKDKVSLINELLHRNRNQLFEKRHKRYGFLKMKKKELKPYILMNMEDVFYESEYSELSHEDYIEIVEEIKKIYTEWKIELVRKEYPLVYSPVIFYDIMFVD